MIDLNNKLNNKMIIKNVVYKIRKGRWNEMKEMQLTIEKMLKHAIQKEDSSYIADLAQNAGSELIKEPQPAEITLEKINVKKQDDEIELYYEGKLTIKWKNKRLIYLNPELQQQTQNDRIMQNIENRLIDGIDNAYAEIYNNKNINIPSYERKREYDENGNIIEEYELENPRQYKIRNNELIRNNVVFDENLQAQGIEIKIDGDNAEFIASQLTGLLTKYENAWNWKSKMSAEEQKEFTQATEIIELRVKQLEKQLYEQLQKQEITRETIKELNDLLQDRSGNKLWVTQLLFKTDKYIQKLKPLHQIQTAMYHHQQSRTRNKLAKHTVKPNYDILLDELIKTVETLDNQEILTTKITYITNTIIENEKTISTAQTVKWKLTN